MGERGVERKEEERAPRLDNVRRPFNRRGKRGWGYSEVR
jgi:hypothetical protein